ncbi:unnamed protein product, partial [Laminaria digitata]
MAHGNDDADAILADIATGDKARIFDTIYRCAGVNRAELLAPSLKHAASVGNADLLVANLALGACPNTVYSYGDREPVLHVAAVGGHERTIWTLLQAGAHVNALDGNGRNALQLLAHYDNPDAADVLLAFGADSRHRSNANDSTALEMAVKRRNDALVRTILYSETNPEDPRSLGYTALHAAAAGDEVEAIRLMVEAGDNVDLLDGRGQTPLHVAVKNDNPEAVRFLCDLGADKNKRCRSGFAPLHLGMFSPGTLSAVIALLDAGADADLRQHDSDGVSALDMASVFGRVHIVTMLLDHGADAKAVDSADRTALFRAAEWNTVGAIHVLKEAGADVHAKDMRGRTPFDHACECLNLQPARALLGYGASVNTRDEFGKTPLHRAARASDGNSTADMVDFLLKSGADETAVDFEGSIPAQVVGLDAQEQQSLERPPWPSPRVESLLDNAQRDRADRAWGRRSFLVMCRAHPTRAKPRLPERAGGESRRAGGMVTRRRARKL